MRALLQRVRWAQVEVEGRIVGRIEQGMLVYLGLAVGDSPADAAKLALKVVNLRIFEDQDGKLNLSVQDVRGGVLVISNFALLGDTRKGRRPEFLSAAGPELAQRLYDLFVKELRECGLTTACGVFRAGMIIHSAADGPVNLIVDVQAETPGPARRGAEPSGGADKENEADTPSNPTT